MDNKKKLMVFCISMVFAIIFWRLRVLLFYSDGALSFLRKITGLTIHHYHYGVLLILFSALLLIFYKRNAFSIGLMGFGLGSVFDSVISGLLKTNTIRGVELTRYNQSLYLTIFLFFIIIILSVVFYLIGERYKKK